MWFAEAGYMRMQMTMGSKDDIRKGKGVQVIWSGIEYKSKRTDQPYKAFARRKAKIDREYERKHEKMAAASKKKAEEEQAKQKQQQQQEVAIQKTKYEHKLAKRGREIKRWTARCKEGKISPAQLKIFRIKLDPGNESESETDSEDEFYGEGKTDYEETEDEEETDDEEDTEDDDKSEQSISSIWSESPSSSAGEESWTESESEAGAGAEAEEQE